MIIAINYADEKYETLRKYNTLTAYKKGFADKVIEFSPKDISIEFKENNKAIFSNERGAGLWLWKPYVICKAMDEIDYGDYLFYCDAGAYYVNRIQRLIDAMECACVEIMPFELPLLARQWTKKETYRIMNYDNFEGNQILVGYLLVKKSEFTEKILHEWINYAQNEHCISPKQFSNEKNNVDFVEHREDQSIFSIVCRKYNLITFRDPSQFGDRSWQYAWNRVKGEKKWDYSPQKYMNSPYPRILVSNRKIDPIKYKRKILFEDILWRLGLYSKYYLKYYRKSLI